MTPLARLEPSDRRPANGWNRRIFLVAARPGQGPLTELTAGAQVGRQERVFMPLTRPCRRAVGHVTVERELLEQDILLDLPIPHHRLPPSRRDLRNSADYIIRASPMFCSASVRSVILFDHFVGARENSRWNCKAERFGGF